MTQPLSLSAQRALRRLGSNISMARRRRHWTQRDMAEQMGVSVSTVRRLESGDPGVALQHLLATCSVLGAIEQFNTLLDTRRDDVGLQLQDSELPTRIRTRQPVAH